MTHLRYRLNKRVVTEEDREYANIKGYRLLADTLTEERVDEDGTVISSSTYYIFTGKAPLYGMCCKINGRYVFARWSRYDSVTTDFKDLAIDCSEFGCDDDWFETKHYQCRKDGFFF